MTVLAGINFSYSMSMNLFPIFSGLRTKTNKNMINATYIATAYGTFIYLLCGYVGIFLFGVNVMNDQNIMTDIGYSYELDKSNWTVFLFQLMFMIVLMFHIAPCFFPGKEALLIVIDEIKRKSISENLKIRIQ